MAKKTTQPIAGKKRGPGRPPRNAVQPALKKARIASPARTIATPKVASPTAQSPAPASVQEEPVQKLPPKISEHRPLPTLPSIQALSLSDEEYQSIAASAVLAASIERSRVKWVGSGVFKRYWVKPETGKHARPPPPNNPEVKWQKHQGPCRIRIEPHILEAELYVEQKPRQMQQVKQYVPPPIYRPTQPYNTQQQTATPFQQRVLSPLPHAPAQPVTPSNTALPVNKPIHTQAQQQLPPAPLPPTQQQTPSLPPQATRAPPPPPADKRIPPDPVISMLASRASSDPVLKALMKEVATGNASQDQLRTFQGHIDELTKIINDKKRKEEQEKAANTARAGQPQQNEMTRSGTNSVAPPTVPFKHNQPVQQARAPVFIPPAPTYQLPPPPPPSSPQAVVLAFTSPGASEDRFLFPQCSILEPLSPQHLLASFIHTQKGSEAADPNDLDPDTEYWQPITLMVEVAYKREHFLDCIKRWVKPADEVRKIMEETIERCTRAPVRSLAMRLPFKGSAMADTEEIMSDAAEDKAKAKTTGKYVRKNGSKAAPGNTVASHPETAVTDATQTTATTVPAMASDQTTSEPALAVAPAPAIGETQAVDGSKAVEVTVPTPTRGKVGRPRRDARKSVRIDLT